MKLIIDIPKEYYKRVENEGEEITHSMIIFDLLHSIANGTPIPDNATNGEVIKALFKPNWIRRMDDVVREEYEFNEVWWNAPYQKGGKVE